MKKKILLLIICISLIPVLLTFAQQWQVQSTNISTQLKGVYMVDHITGWACGDNGVLLHTEDAGETWTNVPISGQDLHQIVFKNDLIGVVVGDNGFVSVTSNGGLNWNSKNSNTSSQLRSVTFAGGSTFFAAGRDGAVIKSTDDGNTWSSLSSGTTERLLAVSAVNNFVWIGGRDGILIFSSDGGASFSPMASPAPDDIKAIQFVNSTTGFAAGSNSFFMFTDDGGANWTSRSAGILVGLNGLFFSNEQTGWVVGGNGTLYSTTNAGLTWINISSGTTQDLNSIHSFDGENSWAVGNAGVITTNYSPATSVEQINSELPNKFVVEQNYPNPFNPVTKIQFSVPVESNIAVEVFNITGKKVAELLNETLSPGNYSVNFNASEFSSGIYFYTVRSDNFSVAKKMTLLR